MKYKVGDVVLYNHADCLIVDIDYNWGCPNYIVRLRYDQGRKLSEERYGVPASALEELGKLLKRSTTKIKYEGELL